METQEYKKVIQLKEMYQLKRKNNCKINILKGINI